MFAVIVAPSYAKLTAFAGFASSDLPLRVDFGRETFALEAIALAMGYPSFSQRQRAISPHKHHAHASLPVVLSRRIGDMCLRYTLGPWCGPFTPQGYLASPSADYASVYA